MEAIIPSMKLVISVIFGYCVTLFTQTFFCFVFLDWETLKWIFSSNTQNRKSKRLQYFPLAEQEEEVKKSMWIRRLNSCNFNQSSTRCSVDSYWGSAFKILRTNNHERMFPINNLVFSFHFYVKCSPLRNFGTWYSFHTK